ncbi:hypothetical protein GCM10010967_30150 [Dyadobacter beijingensis]|uniref:DUF4349 domain-containing protein n=1 Tax=Dyadobacter beijingensis TaxID=365489 RepID=A0ABQ2I076_9BACT|nr:DUF4349 domain-containing protein [Dyadobacter beijingensis]GGM94753.1 hypothetical protein GCM10010967_30150 [Dyadobacter beijingensis]
MKALLSISIMWLMLAGCSGPKKDDGEAAYMVEAPPPPPEQNETNESVVNEEESAAEPAPPKGGTATDRKFIKTGRIEFETEDAVATRKTIMASVKASNAYVSRDDEDRSSNSVSYTIVVHVPAARFETFLASATKGVTDFREKSISNEDVTAQYVDTESRLKTKKDIENRYRALLTKANNVKEILEIERELGEIRTDIEATEAQFRQLNGDIKYSTLHIVFFKSIETSSPFLTEIADAFKEGVGNLRAFTVVFVAVWPFALLAVGVVAVLDWWRKKRRKALKQEASKLS